MGTISSGLGLFSGIDARSIIDQLIQIEARPKQLAQRRLLTLQSEQAALLDLNSALMGLRNASAAFNGSKVFQANKATSSSPAALTATAGLSAAPGTYSFTVNRLVSTDQRISRGFADADTSGVGATSFKFEIGGGRADGETLLAELNGGAGIDRGTIRMTDGTGASTTVDLSRAVTVNDVLSAINGAGTISVSASVTDTGFVLTDTSGGGGFLTVADVFGSTTATTLGLAGSASGTLTGSNVYQLTESTPLSILNDGRGVSYGDGGAGAVADFSILVEDNGGGNGTSYEVILGAIGSFVDDEFVVSDPAVVTIGDFIERIEAATSNEVTAVINGAGNGLTLQATSGTRQLTVNAGVTRKTSDELGLTGLTGQNVDTKRLYAGINTVLAASLHGGAGIGAGTFQVTQRDGTVFNVNVDADDTLAEIIRNINAGSSTITAKLNGAGNGISLVDSTTGGSLVITDTSGTSAADLGIATAGDTDGRIDSGNLQHQWIGRGTRLDSLNAGQGLGTGTIRLTDSSGASADLSVTKSIKTVGDLIAAINSRNVSIVASLNDTGDGIILTDTAGGANAMKIEDDDGQVAKKLNIAGEADFEPGDPQTNNVINGSYEREVEFGANDTLQDIANKVSAAGIGVDASVIRDGSGPTPHRLVFTSETSGRVGRVTIDTNGFDLGLSTLTRGEDAVVFFGSANPADALLLTSSSNTLDGAVTGVTIDLNTTTAEPVELVVARDVAKIEETMNAFVEAYNTVLGRLEFHTRYNSETRERGALFGDVTSNNVRTSLFRTLQSQPIGVQGDFNFLVQVGLTSGDGGRIEFDRERFRAAYEQDPEGVKDLIAGFVQSPNQEQEIQPGVFVRQTGDTFTTLGVMEQFEKLAKDMTDTVDGLLTRRRQTLDTQIRLQNDRISGFDVQLANKRARLERQFLAMEEAIAGLTSQQQSLGALQALV